MKTNKTLTVCGILLMAAITAATTYGQVIENRKSLKGLAGVGIWIKADQDELKQVNLSLNQLSTDSTLRLRKAGIRILETKDEQLAVKGWPHLTIDVSTMKSEGKLWVFHVTVTVSEWVFLARNSTESLYLTTWNNTGVLGLAEESDMQDTVRKALADAVDKFIDDYLAANPPKTPIRN